jgi:hypothetical protein
VSVVAWLLRASYVYTYRCAYPVSASSGRDWVVMRELNLCSQQPAAACQEKKYGSRQGRYEVPE